MKRFLVTGATGFVGSHVAEALAAAGIGVRALVRATSGTAPLEAAGAEIVRGPLEDRAVLGKAVAGVDAVIHLAARTHARSEAEYRRVNADATGLLLRALLEARGRPARLVFLSSLSAAGPSHGDRPVRALDPPRPLTAYGRSKLAAESACRSAGDRIDTVILRAPAVYGPRDRELFRFFAFAARGWVPFPGGRPRPTQLVHVADLARAILLAATRDGAAGTYHVADPEPYAMADVARLVAEAVGRRARLVPVPPPLVRAAGAVSEFAYRAAGRSTMFNRDKARELLAPGWLCETGAAREALGFETEIPLPAGLRSTAEWYRREGWLKP